MKFEIGITTLLTIIFIILKLCGVISWAWWLVLLPTWGNISLAIIIASFVCLCGCIAENIQQKKEEKQKRSKKNE